MDMQEALNALTTRGMSVSISGVVRQYGDFKGSVLWSVVAIRGNSYSGTMSLSVRGEGLTVMTAARAALAELETVSALLREAAWPERPDGMKPPRGASGAFAGADYVISKDGALLKSKDVEFPAPGADFDPDRFDFPPGSIVLDLRKVSDGAENDVRAWASATTRVPVPDDVKVG